MPAKTESPNVLLGQRVRELRDSLGLSQRAFAERMQELGVKLHHVTVAKIETGKRKVTIEEAFKLAYALHVAPVHLFVPTDALFAPDESDVDTLQIEVAPGVAPGPAAMRAWIRGQVPLTGQDPRLYYSRVPAEQWAGRFGDVAERLRDVAERLAVAFREQDKAEAFNLLQELRALERNIAQAMRMPSDGPDTEEQA